MTCGIYMIRNEENGKVYIGQSVDILSRWKQHEKELNKGTHPGANVGGFQWDWIHYGEENFTFRILIKCEEDKLLLNLLESYYIEKYHSVKCGYNIQPSLSVCRSAIEKASDNIYSRRFEQLVNLLDDDLSSVITRDELAWVDEFSEKFFALLPYNDEDYMKYIELTRKIASTNAEFNNEVFILIEEVVNKIKEAGKNDNQ